MRTELEKYARTEREQGPLAWWGACGEEDAWRWVGTRVRGDRHGTARGVGHGPGRPHLSQRGSRATTNAETLDRHRRDRDRMVMRAADARGQARCISRLTPGQMPVGALPLSMSMSMSLLVCGVAVEPSLVWLACSVWLEGSVIGTLRVHVCERRRSAGRHQRRDEQHIRDALDHDFYPDEGPSRCQPTGC